MQDGHIKLLIVGAIGALTPAYNIDLLEALWSGTAKGILFLILLVGPLSMLAAIAVSGLVGIKKTLPFEQHFIWFVEGMKLGFACWAGLTLHHWYGNEKFPDAEPLIVAFGFVFATLEWSKRIWIKSIAGHKDKEE